MPQDMPLEDQPKPESNPLQFAINGITNAVDALLDLAERRGKYGDSFPNGVTEAHYLRARAAMLDDVLIPTLTRIAELERDLPNLAHLAAMAKVNGDATCLALVYQAGGYVAVRRESLEAIASHELVVALVEERHKGENIQLPVYRTVRNHGAKQ